MIPPLEIRSNSRIPELDGVRGVAILLVVLYHYLYMGNFGTGPFAVFIAKITSLGWTGVDLFFVLSGFLIGGILLDHRASGNYFKTFYVRRVCRILPVYFLWVGLFFVLGWLLSSKASTWWYLHNFVPLPHCPVWSYLVFLQNFWMAKMATTAPAWSVTTPVMIPLPVWPNAVTAARHKANANVAVLNLMTSPLEVNRHTENIQPHYSNSGISLSLT